jgi:hypothetical protein
MLEHEKKDTAKTGIINMEAMSNALRLVSEFIPFILILL